MVRPDAAAASQAVVFARVRSSGCPLVLVQLFFQNK